MKTPQNSFKAAIKAGKPQVGLRSQSCSPLVTEIIGTAGYHFIYFDLEHSPTDTMVIYQQLQALAGTPAEPVMKLPINDAVLMQRLVDMGAMTYVVPMVQNAEDAARAIKICKYPPDGVRGASGMVRANRFGDYGDYFQRANDEICMIMQVETREGLGKLEEIAKVDGVDAMFFGPGDIAADFGHLGNSTHPDVKAAITDGIKQMHAMKKITGMSASEADAEHWFSLGCRFVTVGNDMGLLTKHTRALAAKFQGVK